MLYKTNKNIRIFFICILFTYHSISAEDFLDLHYIGKLVIYSAVIGFVGAFVTEAGRPIARDTYSFLKRNISKRVREEAAIEEKEKEIRTTTFYIASTAWRNGLLQPSSQEERMEYYKLYGARSPIVSREEQEEAAQSIGILTIDKHTLEAERDILLHNRFGKTQYSVKDTITLTDQSEELQPA